MKKTDFSLAPFVLGSIPLWIEPKLLDAEASIYYRRTKIFLLFALSMALQMGVVCLIFLGMVSILHGFSIASAWACFFIWVVSGLFFGVLLGLAEVRDFVKSQNTRGEAGNWEIQQPNNQALQAMQLQIHLQVLHHSLKI